MQAMVASVCLHSPESLMSNQPTDLGQCIQHGLARRAVWQHQCPRQTHTFATFRQKLKTHLFRQS